VAAPWLVLAMLASRPEATAAYNTPTGAAVLAGGAATSVVAYRFMRRLGSLPEDERVLR
jgi:tight adherence protein B